jgi:hypothetical protein
MEKRKPRGLVCLRVVCLERLHANYDVSTPSAPHNCNIYLHCLSNACLASPRVPHSAAAVRHGDELPLEIERLWSTLAANRRNIIPILDFLASLGTHMAYQVQHRCMSELALRHSTARGGFLCDNEETSYASPPLTVGGAQHLLTWVWHSTC